MVMLVRERRREIGVLKAIGAPNRTIGLQFVLEALVLVALGSVVGAAVASFASGGIASALISSSSTTPTAAATGQRGGAAAPAGGFPGGRGRPARRGQPAADLRDGERLPRRHCRRHRRGVRRRHHRGPRPGPAHRPHPSHRSPPRRIAMIEVKNLVRTFKSGDRTIKPVNDVSFELEQGTLASIVGKSGSGKSTLLVPARARWTSPPAATCVVNGVSLASMPDGKLTNYRRRDIGFVFQQFNLIPNLSAVDNVMLPMEFAGVRKAARARAGPAAARTGPARSGQARAAHQPALRRRAAAGGDRPGAGERTQADPGRRTHRQPGRADRRAHHRAAQLAQPGPQHHHPRGHPRPRPGQQDGPAVPAPAGPAHGGNGPRPASRRARPG